MGVGVYGWLYRIRLQGLGLGCKVHEAPSDLWSSHVSGFKVLNTSLGMLKDAVGFRV